MFAVRHEYVLGDQSNVPDSRRPDSRVSTSSEDRNTNRFSIGRALDLKFAPIRRDFHDSIRRSLSVRTHCRTTSQNDRHCNQPNQWRHRHDPRGKYRRCLKAAFRGRPQMAGCGQRADTYSSMSLCSPQIVPAFRSLQASPSMIASYAMRICLAARSGGMSPTPVPKPGTKSEPISCAEFSLCF